uniref:Uncharacterized protein n=1 Tax=Porodaedalea pini TaxID=108901 RepID=A0A5B9R983_9AGAM|nr:hypothetical protein PPIT_000135 [Porodaedalea pini]QEG57031.1 hypothetical protein PPIT_000135 [Porodaedalea pini]
MDEICNSHLAELALGEGLLLFPLISVSSDTPTEELLIIVCELMLPCRFSLVPPLGCINMVLDLGIKLVLTTWLFALFWMFLVVSPLCWVFWLVCWLSLSVSHNIGLLKLNININIVHIIEPIINTCNNLLFCI